jgi:hypothetical protein
MRYDDKVSKGRGQKLGALTKELASPLRLSGYLGRLFYSMCVLVL